MGSLEERRRPAEAGLSAGQDGFPARVVPAADRHRLDSRPRRLRGATFIVASNLAGWWGTSGQASPVAEPRRSRSARPARALLLTRERRDGRRQGMEVGKPIRTHEVEPVKDPVPRERPQETPRERPERKPLPAEAPAR